MTQAEIEHPERTAHPKFAMRVFILCEGLLLDFSLDAPVHTVGGVSSVSPDDDVGLRQNSLDAMANDIDNNFPAIW